MSKKIVILGAGPAGLMAAWEFNQAGYEVTILEREEFVGGMCATQTFQGEKGEYRFDYGGHRFITKNPKLLQFIDDLMTDDLLYAERTSVIRFKGRTYNYPLAIGNLLRNAPISLLAGAAVDLVFKLPFQKRPSEQSTSNFAEWIETRFGTTLYKNFFEGYTGKLWGIDPRQLSADWASQRISLLDLKDVARRLIPTRGATPRTYAKKYRYPKLGFGQMYTKLAEKLQLQGVTIVQGANITALQQCVNRIDAVTYELNGEMHTISCDHVVGTIPLPVVCTLTGFDSGLTYRSLRFFNMPMATENVSQNTWQYLSDPELIGTRLQEPRRRSPFMAPKGQTSVMIEIPCDKGDDVWNMDNNKLLKRVKADLEHLDVPDVSTGEFFTTYTEYAYPMMDVSYNEKRERAITHLNQFDNLVMTGRQGTFRYIFTDTAMEMGLMAAEGIIKGEDNRRKIFDHRNEKTVIEVQSIMDDTKTPEGKNVT
ncbi:FAD-dependent oxidoreductase [Moritella marina ATCC 15381]|uniref:FAD-dependent oxidoreductase n=1 Tax=Moritella marina ATCC 15381 TaxID=1202962 RepID=A0A5J6WJ56_MORMI|nr:FAD-dependent oxidoreductase [Moritella marina]QFI37221.1 FAD-dependent oxidoreductase [Moritella marina ATCC 15381]